MEAHGKATLVLGGTGKTGRRVVERLRARGLPTRVGSRSGEPPFDWDDRATWAPALQGVGSVYVSYYPDLAVPGAVETVGSFAELAVASGRPATRAPVRPRRARGRARRAGRARLGRRADDPTIELVQPELQRELLPRLRARAARSRFPPGTRGEPFVDADDIADVAVAALTDDRHIGQLYELTGPRLLSFAEAVAEIADATGREIRYVPISLEAFASELTAQGVPADVVDLLTYLFGEVLDGRNAHLADGVQRALGRQPRDFAEYAREAAATGVWHPVLADRHAA